LAGASASAPAGATNPTVNTIASAAKSGFIPHLIVRNLQST
jgi:hypothetical protein